MSAPSTRPGSRTSPHLGTPLAWIGLGALLGALVGASGLLAPTLALGLGSSLVALGLRLGARPRAVLGPALALAAALATSGRPPAPPQSLGRAELVGVVSAIDARARPLLEVRSARSVGGEALDLDWVTLPSGVTLADEITLRATLSSFEAYRNLGPHPTYRSSVRRAFARDVVVLDARPAPSLDRWLIELRERVRRSIRASLADDVEGLVVALVLGDPSLEADDAADARASGLSHVVAVSGMHVTFVVGACLALLAAALRRIAPLARRLDPRRLSYLVGASVAPLYAAFAGGSPSAYRAAATASVTWLLAARGRRADALSVTGLVVVLGLVFTPQAARSPAFVLSVLATAAVLEPRGEGGAARTSPTSLASSIVLSATRASIATAPFTLYCFDTLPPLSILANIVVVPVVAAVLLPLGTVHAIVATLSVDLGRAIAAPTEGVVRAFLALSRFFAERGAHLAIPPLDALELVLVGALAFALLTARSKRGVALALFAAGLALSAAEVRLASSEAMRGALRVSFLDVGQGDATLIDFPDGEAWLVDAGGASFGASRDPGREAILPLLRARRRPHLDGVIVTHPHPDHYGGLRSLLRAIPIHEIWDSGQAAEEAPEGEWARTYAGLLVPLSTPEELCGAPRVHAGARLEVISPCPRFDPTLDANDNSIVLRLSFGRRTFLLMGDAEASTEARLAGSITPSDVVKVGHHGSRTSSTEAFVGASRPWLAVISAGANNRFGHPHREVLERWERGAVEVLRTDRDGGVTLVTDGERLEAVTSSGRRLEAPPWLSRGAPGLIR